MVHWMRKVIHNFKRRARSILERARLHICGAPDHFESFSKTSLKWFIECAKRFAISKDARTRLSGARAYIYWWRRKLNLSDFNMTLLSVQNVLDTSKYYFWDLYPYQIQVDTQKFFARIKSWCAQIDILLTSKTYMRSSPNENPIWFRPLCLSNSVE